MMVVLKESKCLHLVFILRNFLPSSFLVVFHVEFLGKSSTGSAGYGIFPSILQVEVGKNSEPVFCPQIL